MYIHVRARVHMGHVCERGRVRVLESFIVKSMLTLIVSRTRRDLNPAPLGEVSIALPTELKDNPKLWQ